MEPQDTVSVNKIDAKKKQLKLISVEFKEASVDSPAFRAHVNYFHTRVEMLEEKLQKSIIFYETKYSDSYENFAHLVESWTSQLLPNAVMLSNGFVNNQAYTPMVVDTFQRKLGIHVNELVKLLRFYQPSTSTLLTDVVTNVIEPYKNKRKTFEYFQTKYDNMLNTYQEIEISNALIDPQSIKNDALQLHEVRKNYLMASLDLVENISSFKLDLDNHLAKSMDNMLANMATLNNSNNDFINIHPNVGQYYQDYLKWVEIALESRKSLEPNIQQAKKQVYEYSLKCFAPSEDLKDYTARNIDNKLVKNIENAVVPSIPPDKSGWLHMKTTVGKPSREIWVRRWCFVRNGVFGMFLLSPSKIYVEETDKFGVFLLNVRQDLEETRKYCFEVKVINGNSTHKSKKNIDIILQAESLKDLKSWLNVFEYSKKFVSHLDNNTLAHELAFKRFSPMFFEFAASTTSSVDQAITTFSDNTTSLLETINCSFSEYEVLSLSNEKLFEFNMDVTPITTKLSQLAILSNYFTKGSWFPNGIMVNIWGTSNWNGYSILDDKGMKSASAISKSRSKTSFINSENYPHYFDVHLKINDLQFKNIFYTVDQRLLKYTDEYLLFKFSYFWYPNAKQKFPTTAFVTKNNLYCYMNTMGFVSLTKIRMDSVISAEVDQTIQSRINIYDADGSQYKLNVLFADRRAVVLKLQLLVEAKAAKITPKTEEILEKMKDIDKEYKYNSLEANKSKQLMTDSEDKINKNNNESRTGVKEFIDNQLLDSSTFWKVGNLYNLLTRKKKLQRNATIVFRHDYDITGKGLFHILFGDLSNAFPRCFFVAASDQIGSINTYWKEYKNVTDEEKVENRHIKDDEGTSNIKKVSQSEKLRKSGESKGTNENESSLIRSLTFAVDTTHHIISRRRQKSEHSNKRITINQKIVKVIDNIYYEIDQEPVFIKLPFCRPLMISMKYLITVSFNLEDIIPTRFQMPKNGSVFEILYNFKFINPKTGKFVDNLSRCEEMLLSWTKYFAHIEFSLIRKNIGYYLGRIGEHGKVIRAIKLCGLLGVSYLEKDEINVERETKEEFTHDVVMFSDYEKKNREVKIKIPERSKITFSVFTMFKVIIKLMVHRILNLFILLLRFSVRAVVRTKAYFGNINKILLAMFIISIFINFLTSVRSSISYWSVKRAENTFKQYLQDFQAAELAVLDKKKNTIYLDDLDILTQDLVLENDNLPFQKYKDKVEESEPLAIVNNRKDIAIKRNELLIELKILQNVEREIIHGDYKNFLIMETNQCNNLSKVAPETFDKKPDLKQYCLQSAQELERLSHLLL